MVVEPIEALEAQEVVEALVEEAVEEEPWVPSTLKLWMGHVLCIINTDQKLGHVQTNRTAPCEMWQVQDQTTDPTTVIINETVTSLMDRNTKECLTITIIQMRKYRYLTIKTTHP